MQKGMVGGPEILARLVAACSVLLIPLGATRAAAPAASKVTPELIEAAKKEGKVVWYTAVDLPVAERLGKAFEAKYPGIELREPIMKIVVISPKEYQGQISGNISSKRGIIEETSEDKGVAQVVAKVPLANLFGYTNDLRSATKGQASFSMEFSHYAPVPIELADIPKPDAKKK